MRKLFSYKRSMFSKLPSRACDPSVPISPPTIFGLLTLLSKKIPKSYFTKIITSNVVLNALIRKTQIRLIDSNKQSNELANQISILLDQLDSKSPPKKNLLEERIKKIRANINKMQKISEI